MICRKDGVYVDHGEGRVDVEIQAHNLRPVHLARIALVDLACTTKDGNLLPALGRFDDHGRDPAFSASSYHVDRRPSIAINKLLGIGEEYRNGVVIGRKQVELLDDLSPIEATVLSNINLSNDEIAEKLSLEESTVRTHIHDIYNKYGSKLSPKDMVFTAIAGDLLRLNPQQNDEIKEKCLDKPLSPSEDVVFRLKANGYTYDEIASKISRKISTVRTHLHNAYLKLNGSHLRENILIAHLNGMDLSEPKITITQAGNK